MVESTYHGSVKYYDDDLSAAQPTTKLTQEVLKYRIFQTNKYSEKKKHGNRS